MIVLSIILTTILHVCQQDMIREVLPKHGMVFTEEITQMVQ